MVHETIKHVEMKSYNNVLCDLFEMANYFADTLLI